MAQTYFAITAPGLEQPLLEELRSLSVKKPELEQGGVSFRATRKALYEVLQQARQPNRLYLRVDEFRARDVYELYRKTARIDWSQWLPDGAQLTLDATVTRSGLQGSGQVQDRVFDGVRDALMAKKRKVERAAQWVEQGKGHVRIIARMHEDRCQLSLDMAGGRMYIRGWRQQTGEAPLRESFASALLWRLGWTPGAALIDPMCGSGTFLIEAARRAAGAPPRAWTRYGVFNLEGFDRQLWAEVAASSPKAQQPSKGLLWGADQDEQVLKVASLNARAACVEEALQMSAQEVSALSPPDGVSPGFMICNPPYGLRLRRARGADAPEQQLLEVFARRFKGWRLGLLVPADFTIAHEALEVQELARFGQGGLSVRFWGLQHKG